MGSGLFLLRYASQYEHALRLLGSLLFRSFAGSLTYDSHVEGNALLNLSSRWIILRHSKTCQARLDLDVIKHLKRNATRIVSDAPGVNMGLWQGRTIQSDFSLSSLYQVTWHGNAQTQQISRCKLHTTS